MKTLEFPITKKGFSYELIERVGQWALIEQVDLKYPDAPRRFEVWQIQEQKYREHRGVIYEEKEMMPEGEDWGTYGWSFFELRDAINWFKSKIRGE